MVVLRTDRLSADPSCAVRLTRSEPLWGQEAKRHCRSRISPGLIACSLAASVIVVCSATRSITQASLRFRGRRAQVALDGPTKGRWPPQKIHLPLLARPTSPAMPTLKGHKEVIAMSDLQANEVIVLGRIDRQAGPVAPKRPSMAARKGRRDCRRRIERAIQRLFDDAPERAFVSYDLVTRCRVVAVQVLRIAPAIALGAEDVPFYHWREAQRPIS